MLHRDDYAPRSGHQVHRTAHAGHHLAGHHPVGQVTAFIDLQPAKHGHIQMTAADQPKGMRTVDRGGARHGHDKAAPGIGEIFILHSLRRARTHADDAVFGLEQDACTGRNEA